MDKITLYIYVKFKMPPVECYELLRKEREMTYCYKHKNEDIKIFFLVLKFISYKKN